MNQGPIILSYVLTTRNKLPYLKEAVTTLIAHKRDDEEIIVIDGASTDGSVEYLDDLFKKGDIDQFVSEPDKGEAHGFNKGFLLAKGELIKVITDDDVFYYDEIRKCKMFMREHPEIDVLGTDGFVCTSTENYLDVAPTDWYNRYAHWKNTSNPFTFGGLGLMLRKNSLPIVGLFNTSFISVDSEFALRLTSGKGTLGWYTGKTWKRRLNPKSNSITQDKKIILEKQNLSRIYPHSNLERPWQRKMGDFYNSKKRVIPSPIMTCLRSVKKTLLYKKNAVKDSHSNEEIDQFLYGEQE